MKQEKDSGQIVKILGIVAVLGIGYLFFATLQPFLSALAWAAVLTYGLYPLYTRIYAKTKERANLSAFLACLILTIGFILPLISFTLLIGAELVRTYRSVSDVIATQEQLLSTGWQDYPFVSTAMTLLEKYERLTGSNLQSVLADNLAQSGKFLVTQLSYMAGNVLIGLIQLGIILLSAFYLFRDGEHLVAWIREALPVPQTRQELLIQRFQEVVQGTIYGNTLVAFLEGIVGGLAFWIVGLPSPILWGTVMAVLAFLPLVGAGIVWVPGAIYLVFKGAYLKVVVLIFAGVIIALLDYVVRNILIGSQSKLHSLLVLLSVLGGIQLFGLLGIVAGPLVVALSMTLIEAYRNEKAQSTSPARALSISGSP